MCRARTYLERAHKVLIHSHNSCSIIELATVIRSREDSHELPFRKKLVSVFHNLQLCNQPMETPISRITA